MNQSAGHSLAYRRDRGGSALARDTQTKQSSETDTSPGLPGMSSLAQQLAHVIPDVHQTAGTTAMQSPGDVSAASPFTFGRVILHLDPNSPWLFTVEGNPTPMAIATELYGADYSVLLHKVEKTTWFTPENAYELVPELLVPAYRAQFHEAMRKVLDKDIEFVEDKVLETWVDSDDEKTLMTYVSWWARRNDLRTEVGQSYFDAFLSRLKRDTWYRDYGLWKGSSSSFLDKLYTEVENHAGELNSLIAQNSVEFGGYRPAWLALDTSGQPRKTGEITIKINRDLVERSANLILAGLSGITWAGDSHIIRDAVVGLPPPEQAAVLREIMSRYDERKWGIFGKYGEAWEGGMLYWLFEDLTSADRERVAASLKANGVLPSGTVDALVAGRGWGGRWLPWTTYKAHEASQFWADYAVKHEGTTSGRAAAVMGSFSSLWLPETAGTTVTTLITARASTPETGLLPQISMAFPRVGAGLALLGTGVTSFNVTINVQEWLLEKDVWTGRKLSQEEVLHRGLSAVSGTLFLGASFTAAAQAPEPSPGATAPSEGGGFGPPRLVYSRPSGPPASSQAPPAGAGGGGREVFLVRGNVVTKLVISDPVPAEAPAPAPAPPLRSVPPQPAPATSPAPGFPAAQPPVVTAAAAGGVTTSASVAPSPGPAPIPTQPTGRTRGDAIPLIWFKHPSYYPDMIQLGGFEYWRNVPTTLPLGEPIGVHHDWWPRIGKTMLLIPEVRGRAADDFREVLRSRYGFDWTSFQADHVQDIMWEGPDSFTNLWPMDSAANMSAGPRQNQFQVVTFRDNNGQVRTMTIQQGRDTHILEGRWFVIVDVRF